MLFDEGGKEKLGGISDAQMQTTLASALSSSNEAFAHSGINLKFSLVYVGLVRTAFDVKSSNLRSFAFVVNSSHTNSFIVRGKTPCLEISRATSWSGSST